MNEQPPAIAIAVKALDGLYMRMAAISQNLANANGSSFQPIEVKFEDALARAARSGSDAVQALQFEFSAGRVYAPGEDRRSDLMIADAARTALNYAALADIIDRRLALFEVAVGGQG